MPSELSPVVIALEHKAWYPLAAALLTLLINLWKRLQPLVWDQIPTRWQWVPAVLVSGAGGFVHATLTDASLTTALAVAFYAMVSGGITAIGVAHTYKRISGNADSPNGPV